MEQRLPYDVLLEATDPAHVLLELDLYWITKGGQDPLAYLARWPGRFRLVHVKDSAGPPDHRMAESSISSSSATTRGTPSRASPRVMRISAISNSRICVLLALLGLAVWPLASDAQQWSIHDMDRTLPPVVDPGSADRPPSDAIVLFGGEDLSQWRMKGGKPAKWKVEAGHIEIVPGSGDMVTAYTAHPDRLPLLLQDHGNPVRYRNLWLRELPER